MGGDQRPALGVDRASAASSTTISPPASTYTRSHTRREVDPLLDDEERAALLAQPLQGRHDAFDRGTDVVATVGAQRRRGRRSDARGRHFAWCARAQSSRTVPRTIPRSAWRVEGWRSDRYRCPATTTTDTYMSAS